MTNIYFILISSLFIGFGTYGVSNIIVHESGPFEIFDRFRVFLFSIPETQYETFNQTLKGTIANIVTCVYCLGVWIALALGLLTLLLHPNNQLTLLYIPTLLLMVFGGLGIQHLLLALQASRGE